MDYITSERFIHDQLLHRAQRAVDKIRLLFKRDGFVENAALAWPAEGVQLDDGSWVFDLVYSKLPDGAAERAQHLHTLIEKSKAYAILVVEQRDKLVQAIFESPHGARCWRLPIERHGDLLTLGEGTIHDDIESLGLIWNRSKATG